MKPSDALVIALVLTLIAIFSAWPHSKDWGYRRSAGVSVVLMVLLVYLLAQTV
jgi:Ca2+/Na+ antiporter